MIKELITDIAYDRINLAQAITRTKLIEYKIKNETLKNWLSKELNGYLYNDSSIPSYRKIRSGMFLVVELANGSKQKIPVSTKGLGKPEVELINFHKVLESIPSIEHHIAGITDSNRFYIMFPPEMLAPFYEEELSYYDSTLLEVRREISKYNFQDIIAQTKQKLLDILMELQNEFPNIENEYKMNDENSHKVHTIITNNIYGGNNPMNIAAGEKVEQKDNSITIQTANYEKLKELGVEASQIEEIRTIVQENYTDKPTLTGKVLKWLGAVSSSMAAKGLYENIPALTEFANTLLQ